MSNKVYEITADATCDLPKQFYRENFSVIPMGYLLDGELYDCSQESLNFDSFYSKVESGSMPSTSLITADQAIEFFEPYLKDGKDVFHICFSSQLSSTYQSMLKAQELLSEKYPDRKIIIIDSKSASGGEGFFVMKLLNKRDEGATIDELNAYALDIRNHCNHFFTVENLFHLYRGGRVSKSAAVIGTTLQIKPILYVDSEGRLIPIGKVMGRKQAVKTMADKYLEKSAGYENDVIYILHGSCPEDAKIVADRIKQALPNPPKIVIDYIGPIIGAHCGKGVLAIFFIGKDREP